MSVRMVLVRDLPTFAMAVFLLVYRAVIEILFVISAVLLTTESFAMDLSAELSLNESILIAFCIASPMLRMTGSVGP